MGAMVQPCRELRERFATHVCRKKDHWTWAGPLAVSREPVFRWPTSDGSYRSVLAACSAVALFAGVRHVKRQRRWRPYCGNPLCVKPQHQMSSLGPGYSHIIIDESGLTALEVLDIRLLGRSPSGVSKTLVRDIREGRAYQWLTGAR